MISGGRKFSSNCWSQRTALIIIGRVVLPQRRTEENPHVTFTQNSHLTWLSDEHHKTEYKLSSFPPTTTTCRSWRTL